MVYIVTHVIRSYSKIPSLSIHKNHALANKEEVAWSDLENEDFIIFREGFSIRDTIFEECRRLGFEPTIICESSQWNFMIEMVSIKQGIAILPQSTQKELDFTGKQIKVLRLTDPQINWQLGIAWRKESYISNATKTWINFVKDRQKPSILWIFMLLFKDKKA